MECQQAIPGRTFMLKLLCCYSIPPIIQSQSCWLNTSWKLTGIKSIFIHLSQSWLIWWLNMFSDLISYIPCVLSRGKKHIYLQYTYIEYILHMFFLCIYTSTVLDYALHTCWKTSSLFHYFITIQSQKGLKTACKHR